MPPGYAMTLSRNVTLYPWFKFAMSLTFWQATWFLYFQNELSAAEAVLLYAVYDVSTTALEVPLGYLSDRLGRRLTLIASAIAGALAASILGFASGFEMFVLGQIALAASGALSSGTDSAMLYESLAADGHEEAIEAQELRAWRFSFSGFAVSAVLGGALALIDQAVPFWVGAVAFGVAMLIALSFREPSARSSEKLDARQFLQSLGEAFAHRDLTWLFAISVLMYLFSHIPYVFGQPFILEALADRGMDGSAPLVSGGVSASMMIVSLATSLVAERMRKAMGLPYLILFAFGIQIALIAALAISNSVFVILLLFLRMVPDSLSKPFALAYVQPKLNDETRATYLSLQSFVGRLLFASTLFFASTKTEQDGIMAYDQIQTILTGYTIMGAVCITVLLALIGRAFVAKRA